MGRPKKVELVTVVEAPQAKTTLQMKAPGEPDGVKFTKNGMVKYAPSEWMVRILVADGWVKA